MFVYAASGKEKKNYNVQSRPAVLELLAKYPHKDIHIFKDGNEADDFCERPVMIILRGK